MTSVIFTKNDAVAQTNFIPGKIYKYYYREFYSGRTVHKIDLLTGKALLK